MFRGYYKNIVKVPGRIPLQLSENSKLLDVVMQEYGAIRREIDTCLANQVAILSFGAATVGLLVAAAGTLWREEPLLSGILLLFVVPAACFLALSIHAGELVRMMRGGLFLHELENWVNDAWPSSLGEDGRVLTWEQWGIRTGAADVDRNNQFAISAVFGTLALGFAFSGFWRLHEPPPGYVIDELLAILLLVVSLGIGLLSVLWVATLRRYAYTYRKAYRDQ